MYKYVQNETVLCAKISNMNYDQSTLLLSCFRWCQSKEMTLENNEMFIINDNEYLPSQKCIAAATSLQNAPYLKCI